MPAQSPGALVEVKVSDEVMPGVISLPHGWGHDLPGIRGGAVAYARTNGRPGGKQPIGNLAVH